MGSLTSMTILFAIFLSIAKSQGKYLETIKNLNAESKEIQTEFRDKREVDETFLRRYNHMKHRFGQNPLAMTFFKYFMRNRGQKRERRQIQQGYNYSRTAQLPYYNYNNNVYSTPGGYNLRSSNNYYRQTPAVLSPERRQEFLVRRKKKPSNNLQLTPTNNIRALRKKFYPKPIFF